MYFNVNLKFLTKFINSAFVGVWTTQPQYSQVPSVYSGAQGWQPYHHPVPLSWNLGNLTSWNPLDHSRPVTGLLCLYLTLIILRSFSAEVKSEWSCAFTACSWTNSTSALIISLWGLMVSSQGQWISVFCGMTSCRLVDWCQHFEGTCCFHFSSP